MAGYGQTCGTHKRRAIKQRSGLVQLCGKYNMTIKSLFCYVYRRQN